MADQVEGAAAPTMEQAPAPVAKPEQEPSASGIVTAPQPEAVTKAEPTAAAALPAQPPLPAPAPSAPAAVPAQAMAPLQQPALQAMMAQNVFAQNLMAQNLMAQAMARPNMLAQAMGHGVGAVHAGVPGALAAVMQQAAAQQRPMQAVPMAGGQAAAAPLLPQPRPAPKPAPPPHPHHAEHPHAWSPIDVVTVQRKRSPSSCRPTRYLDVLLSCSDGDMPDFARHRGKAQVFHDGQEVRKQQQAAAAANAAARAQAAAQRRAAAEAAAEEEANIRSHGYSTRKRNATRSFKDLYPDLLAGDDDDEGDEDEKIEKVRGVSPFGLES